MPFEPLQQEPIIQQRWAEARAFRAPRAAELKPGDRTFYMLVMLPYPSGRIHMGHVRNYTLGDVVARFRRMRGDQVLNPLGWDSFGLPAENAAIKNGIHPAIWTRDNIQEMKGQIQKMGISYDWDREIASFLPEYYRWNQWFFIKMWERGDVFRAMRNVNWCEALGTVLANEQVVDGKDERTGHPVVQKPMEQYFFTITRYAEQLLADLDKIDWPENVKSMQRHWIGKSEGARLTFDLADGQQVSVFTTRLDTLYGVTFMALSTEHPFIQKAAETDPGLKAFCDQVASQSREERLTSDVKLGHLSRLEAIHPFTGEKVPIFAANYVLMDYGTGAVMGVPAHDERDYEFAEKYGIPIPKVIESENPWEPGILVNSGEFDGMTSEAAADAMVAKLGGRAAKTVTYKLKDWGLSRQRYWGTPIPTVHCAQCGVVPEKEENLPVRLPEDVAFVGKGASPLTTSRSFLECACPRCGKPARRETDTMDTFVDSSWYWMRYLDPNNDQEPFARAEADAWAPVDLYVGGIEHAVMHLMYARYFYKVMRDLGLLSGDEPFKKLICQGHGPQGRLQDVQVQGQHRRPRRRHRPLRRGRPAPVHDLRRPHREGDRLDRVRGHRRRHPLPEAHHPHGGGAPALRRSRSRPGEAGPRGEGPAGEDPPDPAQGHRGSEPPLPVQHPGEQPHGTGQRPGRPAQGRPAPGRHYAAGPDHPHPDAVPRGAAPGRAALDRLGGQGLCMHAAWPEADPAWLTADEVTVVVQINGKVRGRVLVPGHATEAERSRAALACPEARQHLDGKEVVKVVVPPAASW
jgi:leucyl-tRNA synthetase family protein